MFSSTQRYSEFRTGGWVKSVAIDGGHIVAGSCDGNLYFLDLNGNILWKYYTGDWVWSVDINGSRIVAGNGHAGHRVYMFDLSISFDVGDWNWAKSVKIGDDIVVAGTRNFEVYAFSLNGNLLWRRDVGNVWSVAIGKFIVAGSRCVYVFDKDGNPTMVVKTGDWVRGVAITDDYVIAGSDKLYVLKNHQKRRDSV